MEDGLLRALMFGVGCGALVNALHMRMTPVGAFSALTGITLIVVTVAWYAGIVS